MRELHEWRGLTREVGLLVQDLDEQNSIIYGSMPIPESMADQGYDPKSLQPFLRKTLGSIIGLELVSHATPQERLVDISVQPTDELSERFYQDISQGKLKVIDGYVSADGQIPVVWGRIGNEAEFRPLSERRLVEAEINKDIMFATEHEFYDGVARMRLSDVVSRVETSVLKADAPKAALERATLLIHGGAGVGHFTRAHAFDPQKDKLGRQVRARANFSLAPYTGVFQEKTWYKTADGEFQELPWRVVPGSELVPGMALGLLNRHKHVLLSADESVGLPVDLKPSDIWVDLAVHRLDELPDQAASKDIYRRWYGLKPEKKEQLHQLGPDLVETLRLRDPKVQAKLFDFSRQNKGLSVEDEGYKDYHAHVVSSHGITPVGKSPEEVEFFDDELLRCVRLEAEYRHLSSEYSDSEDIVQAAKEASPEGARILVIDTLPEPALIANLYREGVRGIIFKGLSREHPDVGSAALNDMMFELSKEGMQFIQFDVDDVWVFQNRQMVRYGYREAMAQGDIYIHNYGTANEERFRGYEETVKDFVRYQIRSLGEENKPRIVMEDGGGPATMRACNEVGNEEGVLTSAHAIFAEVVDGITSRKRYYHAFWMYPVRELPVRQGRMIERSMIVNSHDGGIGTVEEDVLETLNRRLHEKLPLPKNMINEDHERIESWEKLIEGLCKPNRHGGRTGAPWMGMLTNCYTNYEDAKKGWDQQLSEGFKPLWKKLTEAGYSMECFRYAIENEKKNRQNGGVPPVSEIIGAQVREYLDEVESVAINAG